MSSKNKFSFYYLCFQTFTEPEESQGVFLLAEGFAFLLNLSRLCVVGIVLATNIISLRHYSNVQCHCLRIYVQDSVKFASVIYIATWTPFLLYSFLNGRWILIDEYLFCRMQNYMTNAILLVLMSMGALLFYSKFRRIGNEPKFTSVLTLVAWILPQFIYFVILTAVETPSNKLDFEFLDDIIGRKTPSQLVPPAILYKIGRKHHLVIFPHSL